MAKVLTHQIHVETEEENVTVTIGGDGGVPGGFAKLFNRVIDSQAWARLSDSARAAYIPLVRFADHRNQFRVQIGQAALMKYSGLSRSSVKRAIKDLVASRLVVVVEQGGVSAEGHNESNVYQLMVPADRRAAGAPASPAAEQSPATPPPGPPVNPPRVRQRTPAPASREPGEGPDADPPAGHGRTGRGFMDPPPRGSAAGPALRSKGLRSIDKEHSSTPPAQPPPAHVGLADAVALLEEKGVEPPASALLARQYPYERIVDVVATMEYRKARGKCDNPGGFIREALTKGWQTPKAVTEARARAEAKLRQQEAERAAAAERAARDGAARESASAEERRTELLLESLADDELEILAGAVMDKYAGNTAVLQVLRSKPPRQCRLMKMEIAGLLRGGAR